MKKLLSIAILGMSALSVSLISYAAKGNAPDYIPTYFIIKIVNKSAKSINVTLPNGHWSSQ